MEQIISNIPTGTSKEDIKVREKIIKDFYARWISEHPDKKIWNENLQDYILVKYQSINETYNKAARRYESTLAVFRLTEVMGKAVLKSEKGTKPGDKNQKPYSMLLIRRRSSTVLPLLEQAEGNKKATADEVAILWGSKPTSDKGCHPFYEFPFDSANICRIFLQKFYHRAICKKV